ncbi:hypothetical protein K1719_045367 [Acacia pycnantha]|nr:hypothetical protein K1719_045367 [Acacia pycnantha]
MASAAESFEEEVDRRMTNLNDGIEFLNFRIANLNDRIRVIEQNTSAMKEFIKEARVQGNWPGGNSGRPVPANALGSSGVESDNSNMESKPKEMGGTGKEEGIPLQRTQRRFRVNFGSGPGSEGAEVCELVALRTQVLCIECCVFTVGLLEYTF